MSLSVEENVRLLVKTLSQRFTDEGLLLATAESCTGGWIAQVITQLAGSSRWFDCGFVTYSNHAKQHQLQVPATLFAEDGPGAVSEPVVAAMTAGALANSQADVAVAVSGIAGPDGGTDDKPVGTVWIAWERRQGRRLSKCFQFEGDRYDIRLASVEAALQGLLGLLDNTQPPARKKSPSRPQEK